MVQGQHVSTTVRGMYLLRVPECPPAGLVVGYHGYAEDAAVQLARMELMAGTDCWLLASVRALHLFYRGRTDQVVASWMTRVDRELAVEDNVRFVDTVIDQVRATHRVTRLVHAGFSQGASMAYRAASLGRHAADGVIALGGDVPPELREGHGQRWARLRVLVGRGTRDEWFTTRKLEADLAFLREATRGATAIVFDGGHESGATFEEAAGRWLAELGGPRPGGEGSAR